jgi:hypothetical protein
MTNEQETIFGVKGEWRTVTKPSEVTVGQRVRYSDCDSEYKSGYESPKFIERKEKNTCVTWNGQRRMTGTNYLFEKQLWRNIQAFFPLPVRKSRKVAKVIISTNDHCYWFFVTVGVKLESMAYSKRSHAIRGAKRFCKAIGYECEIVK